MENSSQGSFIPKRSTGKVVGRRVSKRIYIFSYIAYALFFGTLLSVAGIFFLNKQAETKLDTYIQELVVVGDEFDRSDMEFVGMLSDQLATAESLLTDHLAPSLLFDELEKVVVKNIQLSGIEYSKDPQGVRVTFKGAADSFDTLLFQRDIMNNSEIFSAARVSGVTYGNTSVEAVGNSARSAIESLVTEARLTFSFEDESVREQIGYTPRTNLQDSVPSTVEPSATSSSSQS